MNISLMYNYFLGETSPLFAARVDSPVNEMGARRMENMIPMLSGGLRKRPGTWHDGPAEGKARLIDWLLSDGSCLILELTAGKIRVWKEGQIIQEFSVGYTEEQISEVHYAVSANEMWIVHKDCRPTKLTWEIDKSLEDKQEEDPEEENQEGSVEETPEEEPGPQEKENEEAEKKVVVRYPIFTKAGGEKDFITENNRPSCVAFDSGRLCFAGSNNEPNRIYLSRAPNSVTGKNRYTDFTTEELYVTEKDISYIEKDEDGNEIYEPELDDEGNVRYEADTLAFEIISGKNDSPSYYLIMDGKKYDAIHSANHLSGTSYTYHTLTLYFEPMYFVNGMISGQSVGELRLTSTLGALTNGTVVTGGTGVMRNIEPSAIRARLTLIGEWYRKGDPVTKPKYATKTEITENLSITASHAIVIEENDMHGSRIQWISANKHFLAATERATWNDTGEIPTPATFDMNIVDFVGANHIQPKASKDMVVYSSRDGKSIRALVWNQNEHGSGYIDMDISEQAAHLFTSGIKDFAVMDYPYPMIWIATNSGELISCTVNIRGGMIAYARHPMEGAVEAVAVAAQKTGDVLYLAVNRGGQRNIEHLILEDLINADYSESHYVDAGERRDYEEPTNTIEGLERFAGQTVRIFADGAVLPPVTVGGEGTVELQTPVSKVHLGLPYKSAFSPNMKQLPANGTSLGKKRRIEKITLQLFKSLGGKAGTTEDKSTTILTQRFGSYELGTAPHPFTGEIDIAVSGNIDTEGKLVVTQDEPAPFTLLALVERVALLEA